MTVSPVWETASKPGYGPALGLGGLAALRRSAAPGVRARRGHARARCGCLSAGAVGVAVRAPSWPRWAEVVAALLAALEQAPCGNNGSRNGLCLPDRGTNDAVPGRSTPDAPPTQHPLTTRSAMPTRTARTAWNGTLETGTGQVELSSSKVGTYDVSFPKRAADEAGGSTSPEELIAAAHSACFAMQLSADIAAAGGTPQSLEVTADVSLGPDEANGGFRLTGIALKVVGEVEGLDEAGLSRPPRPPRQGARSPRR